MSKRDEFHEVVKTALQKDGWRITHDPLRLKWGTATIQIDLGAEPLLAAEKGEEKLPSKSKALLLNRHCRNFIQLWDSI